MSYEDTHLSASGHINAPKGLKPVVASLTPEHVLKVKVVPDFSSDTPPNPGVAPKTAPLAPGKPDEKQPYRQPVEHPKPAPPKKSGDKNA